MRCASALLLSALLSTPRASAQQAGDLDSTFSADGIAITNINPGNDFGLAMAVQPDGRIVVAGMTTAPPEHIALVRYLPDGDIDGSFGTDGVVITPVGVLNSRAASIAIQPDGRILIGGEATVDPLAGSVFMLARYHADGTLDNSFGIGGILTDDIGSGAEREMRLALQADGMIVVAGQALLDIAVVRYTTNGSRDSTFATDGLRVMDIDGGPDGAPVVALQQDGNIVAACYSLAATGTDADHALFRCTPNGDLDPAFGTGGIAVHAVTAYDDMPEAIAIQPDGRIVVAGVNIGSGFQRAMLARYLADGSVDASFAQSGATLASVGNWSYFSAMTLLPDGKIVAAGWTDGWFLLMRYNGDGSLDSGFGDDGVVVTEIGSNAWAAGLAIQPDGRLLLCGAAWFAPEYADVIVARYHMDSEAGIIDSGPDHERLQLFPNPVSDSFSLVLPGAAGPWLLRVHDATGRIVYQERTFGPTTRLDARAWSPGIYHVMAEQGTTRLSGRVLVAR